MLELAVGQRDYFHGFITKALFIRGRSQEELEQNLGYGSRRLAGGYWLLFAEKLPTADDFEFAGYTHFSGGKPEGHKFPAALSVEQRLAEEIGSLRNIKERIVRDVFRISGPERIAKIIPVDSGRDYPPGAGIPQWKLKYPGIVFRVITKIDVGERYMGDYK